MHDYEFKTHFHDALYHAGMSESKRTDLKDALENYFKQQPANDNVRAVPPRHEQFNDAA